MNTVSAIVSIIFVAGALVLALRGLRFYGLSFEKKAWMAVAWVLIIVVLAYLLTRMGAQGPLD